MHTDWDIKDWKRRLAKLLKEHPDIDDQTTGRIEINLNRGSITKAYKVETESRNGGAKRIITMTELK
ncbi:MAG: hypothetical protein AB1553_01930 [Nitrospirota bacterium]